MTAPSLRIGYLVFPDFTQLDRAAPYEEFASMPGSALHLIWKEAGPVSSGQNMASCCWQRWVSPNAPRLDLLRPSNRPANKE
jgi:cyclohexyl-isocyanide hydratase